MTIHKPVLLNETVESLNLKSGDVVVDATLGGGGHAQKILEKIGDNGKLIAFDKDMDAINRFKEKAGKNDRRIILIHEDFSNLKNILADLKIEKVNAIMADLGISSDQLEDKDRGISFQKDAFLDMRMDRSKGITAADVLNTYEEKNLARILKEFADEKYAGPVARSIITKRTEKPFTYTSELVDAIGGAVPEIYKRRKIHYATKTFQALRMEVNREIESLRSFLFQAVEVLAPGGRLAIITFHSGEDSLVKYTFRENARGCICPPEFPVCQCHRKPIVELITRRHIAPSENEVSENPRARSAKLRVAEKV